MPHELTQSQSAEPIVFLMIDSTLHIAGKTTLAPTVTISKNGAGFFAPAGAVTEIGAGWYKIAGNATDTNTLGPLIVHADAAGADPVDMLFQVVKQNRRTASMDLVLQKTTNITGFNDIADTDIVTAGAITTAGGKVSGVATVDVVTAAYLGNDVHGGVAATLALKSIYVNNTGLNSTGVTIYGTQRGMDIQGSSDTGIYEP